MATANAWLQKQRKSDLVDIAGSVGMSSFKNLNKPELETAVEQYLRDNQTSLQSEPKVAPFYAGVDPASPVRHNAGPAEQPTKKRRQTIKAREEIDEPNSLVTKASKALATTTPARAKSLITKGPPISPSVLANKIEASTTSLRQTLSTRISATGLPSTLSHRLTTLRASLSSVTSIELLTLAIEAFGLRHEILPLRYLTTIPAVPALGTGPFAIKIPDLFALLTLAFWGPFTLWAITSIFLPLLGAYFINLKGSSGYDAVSYNATKALVAWVVYIRDGVSGESKAVVERGLYGGATGMLVGAGVGGLAAFYDAVLNR